MRVAQYSRSKIDSSLKRTNREFDSPTLICRISCCSVETANIRVQVAEVKRGCAHSLRQFGANKSVNATNKNNSNISARPLTVYYS